MTREPSVSSSALESAPRQSGFHPDWSRAGLRLWLDRIADSRWLAYLFITLMQLKTLWKIGMARDLTSGDSTQYFHAAARFAHDGTNIIIWSPLYTDFWGWFVYLTRDVYLATIGHRVAIILILGYLVYEVMRRLLPPLGAFLVTAWWIVLPINFNALYEVHLFAVIPILICWVLLLSNDSHWMRGVVCGLLLLTTLLVRNETMIAFAALLAVSLLVDSGLAGWLFSKPSAAGLRRTFGGDRGRGREWDDEKPDRVTIAVAYLLPLAIAGLLVYAENSRSVLDPKEFDGAVRVKHTLNVAQIYAFGYMQRSGWKGDPWSNPQVLMKEKFGSGDITMKDAFLANPLAMTSHFIWNIGLIPNGIETALFNMRAGPISSDYLENNWKPEAAVPLSLLLATLWFFGARQIYRDRKWWYREWFWPHRWGLLAMGSVVLTVLIVMVMQRPRPSYMFNLSIVLMGFTVLCGWALLRTRVRWPQWRWITPLIMVLALILTPAYWSKAKRNSDDRATYEKVKILQPYRDILIRPGNKIAIPAFDNGDVALYISDGGDVPPSVSFDFLKMRATDPLAAARAEAKKANPNLVTDPKKEAQEDGVAIERQLTEENVTHVLVDERLLLEAPSRAWIDSAAARGWKIIGLQDTPRHAWRLYERPKAASAPMPERVPVIGGSTPPPKD